MAWFSFLFASGCAFKPEIQSKPKADFEHFFKTRKVYSLLVDTRSVADFEQNHLPNAHNIPMAEDFLAKVDALLEAKNAPKSLLLFLYAADETKTGELKQKLEQWVGNSKQRTQHKIRVVYYLNGGFAALSPD